MECMRFLEGLFFEKGAQYPVTSPLFFLWLKSPGVLAAVIGTEGKHLRSPVTYLIGEYEDRHLPAVSSEPAGYFETVFADTACPYEYIRLYETGEIPPTNATHFLFMGGPMSVNDEQDLPYLKEEKALIRDSVRQGRPVLGICLGAQLIASAFGARVYPFIQETGWRELTREPAAGGSSPRSRRSSLYSSSMGKHLTSRQVRISSAREIP